MSTLPRRIAAGFVSSVFFSAASTLLLTGPAHAISVVIDGAPIGSAYPGSGTGINKNNVLDNATEAFLKNPGDDGSKLLGKSSTTTGAISVVGSGNLGFAIDWYFAGAESGHTNQLNVPGFFSHFESNQNNRCAANSSNCGNNYVSPTLTPPASPDPPWLYLGTSTQAATDTLINFSLDDLNTVLAALDNHNSDPTKRNNKPNTNNQVNVPSIIYAYLKPEGGSSRAYKTTSDSTSLWIMFAFNDDGSPNDNHDDYVGVLHVRDLGDRIDPPQETPIPGALPLFASVLAGAGLIARRRKKKAS